MTGWDEPAPAFGAPPAVPEPASSEGWDPIPPARQVEGSSVEAASAIALGEEPDADALLSALCAADPQSPRLDGSDVVRVSQEALQVILAAMASARSAGGGLVLVDPSFALNLTLETFGFTGDNEPFTVEYS